MSRETAAFLLGCIIIGVSTFVIATAEHSTGFVDWLHKWQTLVTGIFALIVGAAGYFALIHQSKQTQHMFRAATGDLDPEFYIEARERGDVTVMESMFVLQVSNRNRHPIEVRVIRLESSRYDLVHVWKTDGQRWMPGELRDQDAAASWREWRLLYRIPGMTVSQPANQASFTLTIMRMEDGSPVTAGEEIRVSVEYDLFGARTERRRVVLTTRGHDIS